MVKALALVSGGLDSILAAKLVQSQGIEVTGVCFKSAFFGPENAIRMTAAAGIPLIIVDFTDEHIEMTKQPKHGYGKNMNPCIDCHAMMLKFAGQLMEERGDDFLITGEVLNQRPMSQNLKSLNIVKKESGYSDRILRPLSAKNLPPTDMELSGLVDRERLLGIEGRSRRMQTELAKVLGVTEYPSPAGGCSLTEPNFARRLRDLYTHEEDFDVNDIILLKVGRHLRLSSHSKAVSTRDEGELERIRPLIKDNDYIFNAAEFSGSTIVLRGRATDDDIMRAASLAARYSKGSGEENVKVEYKLYKDSENKLIHVRPFKDEEIGKLIL